VRRRPAMRIECSSLDEADSGELRKLSGDIDIVIHHGVAERRIVQNRVLAFMDFIPSHPPMPRHRDHRLYTDFREAQGEFTASLIPRSLSGIPRSIMRAEHVQTGGGKNSVDLAQSGQSVGMRHRIEAVE